MNALINVARIRLSDDGRLRRDSVWSHRSHSQRWCRRSPRCGLVARRSACIANVARRPVESPIAPASGLSAGQNCLRFHQRQAPNAIVNGVGEAEGLDHRPRGLYAARGSS